MKLVDKFVSRELLVNVLFAIAILSLVLVVGNIFRKLLPLLVNHDVPVEYLLAFIAYVFPFSLIFTIPWGLLTAILLVFGRLSADNELIALRANGVSVPRVAAYGPGVARDAEKIAQHHFRSGDTRPDGAFWQRPGDRSISRAKNLRREKRGEQT